MRNILVPMLTRIVLTAGVACLLLAPCHAQKAQTSPKPADETASARLSTADASSLLTRIKALDSPTSRVYLYSRVASWLSQNVGDDQDVRRVALEAASAGVSDLHRYESEVPPAPAAMLYARLLAVVSKHDPQKAEEMKRAFPLRREVEETEGDKANKAFYAALSKLDNPETAAQGAAAAAALIESGAVPASVLLGELTRLDKAKSPALPRLLASALVMEERKPGALPLQIMFFLSYVYLKESTPTPLQARFLAAALRGTRLGPSELKGNPAALNGAISLLQQTLPVMQKLTPDLYAEASARLASLAPAASPETAAFERVKSSTDPLAQLLTEADAATDESLKGELLASAAREARRQGKLRLAAELMASSEDDRRTPSENHVSRDEFLTGVVQDSLAQKDVETARFAASKIKSPVERAEALRPVARHLAKSDDFQSALGTLGEAQKSLEGAADGREVVSAYLHLAADFAEMDGARASEAVREANKVAGRLRRSPDVAEGTFNWRLFPVSDAAIRTFQALARTDREGALGLANTMQPKELAIAAALGVYSSTPK
ncbi:MAG TPA: hypothetical protein VFZ44_02455 [Pyrinomonadaceae bacterium]